MAIADNKYVQIDGAPTTQGQKVKESVRNEELTSFEEYLQTGPQVLNAGVKVDLTCDGSGVSFLKPDGVTGIWNPVSNTGTLISGAYYDILTTINVTATVNNTTIVIGFENTLDPLDRFEEVLFLSRSGVAETVKAHFKFPSTGSTFKITAEADKTSTINEIVFDGERRY